MLNTAVFVEKCNDGLEKETLHCGRRVWKAGTMIDGINSCQI